MFGITLETARNIAIAVVVLFVMGAVAAAWLMKTIVQKVAVIVILLALAFAVWSQRTSLEDCADKVQENFELAGTDVSLIDTECTFFGFTVTISDPRD